MLHSEVRVKNKGVFPRQKQKPKLPALCSGENAPSTQRVLSSLAQEHLTRRCTLKCSKGRKNVRCKDGH